MAADGPESRLNDVLLEAGLEPLEPSTVEKFAEYLSLILRWNERMSLTSVRTENAIIIRHLAESVVCATALPKGIATLLDFGSGAGLPGIPIALCRPEIAVTLAESQGKKAAFLQEAIRTLELNAKVHADRAETLRTPFDCVVLRAVDKMPKAVAAAVPSVANQGWLALMTTKADRANLEAAAGSEFGWQSPTPLPGATDRIAVLGTRRRG